MYQQQFDPNMLLIYGIVSIGQVVVPFLLFIGSIWLVVKAISSLLLSFSPDRGLTRLEQIHRHRLQNFAAFMAFAAFVTGLALLLWGDTAAFRVIAGKVRLPGVELENVEVYVFLFGLSSSILWMLLKFVRLTSTVAKEAGPSAAAAGEEKSVRKEVALSAPEVRQDQALQIGGWLRNMTYTKAGLITLVLLPIINVVAIPVGIVLFVMAAGRAQSGPK